MLDQDFWTNVASADALDCWPWQGDLDATGVPEYRGKPAARLAYFELIENHVSPSLRLPQICQNNLCVNPYHCDAEPLPSGRRRRGGFNRFLANPRNAKYLAPVSQRTNRWSADSWRKTPTGVVRVRNYNTNHTAALAAYRELEDHANFWTAFRTAQTPRVK